MPHAITVNPDTKPHQARQAVDAMGRSQLAANIIQLNSSAWRSQVLVVDKAHEPGMNVGSLSMEGRLRPVVSYKVLDSVTVFDAHPM